MWYGQWCANLLVEGLTMLALRQAWSIRAAVLESRGMRLDVSRLGNRCWAKLLFADVSVFMLKGMEKKWHQMASLSPLSLWMLPLRDVLQEDRIISPLHASGILQIVPSASDCLPASSQGVGQHPQGFITAKPLQVARNHENQPLLFFQPIALRKCSPCAFHSVLLSLPSFSAKVRSLSSTVPMFFSPPKSHLCTSYLLQLGFFFPFSCEDCFISLQVDFWAPRMIW